MAWGDIAAGLGGALEGGLGAYKWQQERQDKKEHDELVNDIKMQLQELKGTQAKEQITLRQQGRMALQELMNSGKITLADVEGKWDTSIARMHEQGLITRDEMRALNNLEVADRNASARRYAADQARAASEHATDVGATTTRRGQDITASTTRRGQDITAGTAANEEGGRNWRFGQALPGDVIRAEADAARGEAAQIRAVDPFGNNVEARSTVQKPKTWLETWEQIQNQGQAPHQGPIDPLLEQKPLLPPPQPPAPGLSQPPQPGMSTPNGPASVAPQAVVPPPAPSAAAVPKGAVPVNPRMVQPAPVAAPPPTAISPINRGAGRLPGGAPLPSAAAPGGRAGQLTRQMVELGTQIKAMPPGPQQEQAKQQLAILRAQLIGAK